MNEINSCVDRFWVGEVRSSVFPTETETASFYQRWDSLAWKMIQGDQAAGLGNAMTVGRGGCSTEPLRPSGHDRIRLRQQSYRDELDWYSRAAPKRDKKLQNDEENFMIQRVWYFRIR